MANKHGGSRPKVRPDDERGGKRPGAGRKPRKILLKLDSLYVIEVDGQVNQYVVVDVTPHLTLRQAS